MSVRKKLAPCCWSAVCSSWTKLLEIRPLTPHHHQAPGCEWTWLEVDWKGASRIVTNYHVNLKYSDMENWHLKTSVPFVLLEIWGNELGRFSFLIQEMLETLLFFHCGLVSSLPNTYSFYRLTNAFLYMNPTELTHALFPVLIWVESYVVLLFCKFTKSF